MGLFFNESASATKSSKKSRAVAETALFLSFVGRMSKNVDMSVKKEYDEEDEPMGKVRVKKKIKGGGSNGT
jgi:hypothetical protein